MNVVKTGDIILCSNNTSTAFILKTFTCSDWNHVGIAIRVKNKKITFDEGDLHVLEINTEPRMDILTGKLEHGIGLTSFEYCKNLYNKIAIRRMDDKYRTEEFLRRTIQFVEQYRGITFSSSVKPFLSVFIGVSFTEDYFVKTPSTPDSTDDTDIMRKNKTVKDKNKTVKDKTGKVKKKDASGKDKKKKTVRKARNSDQNEFFCSEITAKFFFFVFQEYDMDVMFGNNAPLLPALYTPGHYAHSATPESVIFPYKEDIIYTDDCDPGVTLLQPLVLSLAFGTALYYILHHSLPDDDV
jgi:hypothetical protein